MNIWRRGPLHINPYYRTAFKVARLPREIVRHKTVVRVIGQTRQVVETGSHEIQSQPVTSSEVNAAEQILLDPTLRILEELLEHETESLPLEGIRKVSADIRASIYPNPDVPMHADKHRVTEGWAMIMVDEFLKEKPGLSPSFGSLELEIAPPFEREGDS